MTAYPFLGFGLGLRTDYYEDILSTRPKIDWFEALSENYMVPGGKPLHYLDRIRADYPVVLHGVSMSIGSSDPLNMDYLAGLKALIARVEPKWVSDHLCWTGVSNRNMHDLLPLPYTETALTHVVERVARVQDFLGRRLLIENVSSYVSYVGQDLTEWDFLAEVARRADCMILLDVNNIYVSSFNHEFDPRQYIDAIPVDRVCQFHLAGHRNMRSHIIDTHDQPIIDPVWRLFEHALKRFGAVSAMIERDDNMPPFAELLAELEEVRRIAAPILQNQAA